MILKTHKQGLAQNGKSGGPVQRIYSNKSGGFTLIELLIVIAIIGLLAGLVAYSLEVAREKAKNSTVKTDITQLMQAMEVYKVDAPVPTANTETTACGTTSGPATDWDSYSTNLKAALIKSFPEGLPRHSESGTANCYTYKTSTSATSTRYVFNGTLVVTEPNPLASNDPYRYFYGKNGSTGRHKDKQEP